MLRKKCIILYSCLLLAVTGFSQVTPADTSAPVADAGLAMDTSVDYDDMLDDLGDFLDSLLAPRSYFLVNAVTGNNYFNFIFKRGLLLRDTAITRKKLVFSPTLGYYHKSGIGVSASGNMADIGRKIRLYQYSITPSFDFIQSRKWTGGVSYTRYITKDSLPFYTTPLQNEISGYFLWRKSWLQPGIMVNYGWGSRSDLEKSRIGRNAISIVTATNTDESITDFAVTTSLRHSFYWLDLSKSNDYIKFTPMLTFTAGTQQYGFNQTTSKYAVTKTNEASTRFTTGNVNLDNELKFQPLSLTLYLRPEYSVGKLYIQPQLIFDYYFPADEKNLSTVFSLNVGFML